MLVYHIALSVMGGEKMKKLSKRMNEASANAFHKSACPCETTCIVDCLNGAALNSVERQVRPTQKTTAKEYIEG